MMFFKGTFANNFPITAATSRVRYDDKVSVGRKFSKYPDSLSHFCPIRSKNFVSHAKIEEACIVSRMNEQFLNSLHFTPQYVCVCVCMNLTMYRVRERSKLTNTVVVNLCRLCMICD